MLLTSWCPWWRCSSSLTLLFGGDGVGNTFWTLELTLDCGGDAMPCNAVVVLPGDDSGVARLRGWFPCCWWCWWWWLCKLWELVGVLVKSIDEPRPVCEPSIEEVRLLLPPVGVVPKLVTWFPAEGVTGDVVHGGTLPACGDWLPFASERFNIFRSIRSCHPQFFFHPQSKWHISLMMLPFLPWGSDLMGVLLVPAVFPFGVFGFLFLVWIPSFFMARGRFTYRMRQRCVIFCVITKNMRVTLNVFNVSDSVAPSQYECQTCRIIRCIIINIE